MHISKKSLDGRGTRNGRPDAKALRAEPFSSTQRVLAELAAMLVDLPVGLQAATDRLDDVQWRVIEEALAIARSKKPGK
jgi:hypothetical protein